jgi:hypothetical protein
MLSYTLSVQSHGLTLSLRFDIIVVVIVTIIFDVFLKAICHIKPRKIFGHKAGLLENGVNYISPSAVGVIT